MSNVYSCAACCAETENEPMSLCDACDQADRDAVAARLNRYRDALVLLRDSYGTMHDDMWLVRVCDEALGPRGVNP